jgi:hypothetical protein
MRLVRWASTVFVLTSSRTATSFAERPSAMRWRISRSRPESRENGSSVAGSGERRRSTISRATAGLK